MKILDLTQGTPEWHAYRSSRIGGSDIPSICKVPGAYKSRPAVMREKLGQAPAMSEFQQKIFKDGHEWESVLQDHLKSRNEDYEAVVIEDSENPEFYISLDGYNPFLGFIEVKSNRKIEKFNEIKEGLLKREIPPVYNYQIQWGYKITGAHKSILFVLCAGNLIRFEVPRSDAIIAECEREAKKFLIEMKSYKSLQSQNGAV